MDDVADNVSTNHSNSREAEPVAVVALGSIFPGRGDTTGFWRDVVEGVDTFTDVPDTHWRTEDFYDSDPATRDRTYGSRGAFLKPTAFDPLSFGIPPNALSTTDTVQLLALVVARNLLDDIERHTNAVLDKSKASVILGVASTTELCGQMFGRLQRPTWIKGMREAGLEESLVQDIAERISSNFVDWRESTFPGLLGNVVAGRIANRLDFGGSNYVTDAACASSLSAMQIALHELQSGDSDLVLTGGVDALNDIFMYMCFSKTPALSPSGDCRPLSADADGTMLGEGVGMLALKRLSDAQRDGNAIHAIVKGLGGGSDGLETAVYAPLASGQAKTLRRAYDKAGYSPSTVELVEAHGTGTVAGDRTELNALHSVFNPTDEAKSPWCAVGSVKAQIGHTKAAAGAAGLLKVVGGLSRKIIPPTIKVREPAKALNENSPFYISAHARPWIRGSAHPRRASVSSFGFGGSNFHVTLEEYTGESAVKPVRVLPSELYLVSARSPSELCEKANALATQVVHEDDLARVATVSWQDFDASEPHRASLVAKTPEHLKTLCEKLKTRIDRDAHSRAPTDPHLHYAQGQVVTGKIALLFSGQGSQYLGMGADLAMAFPQARSVWDAACDNQATAALKLHDLAFPATMFSAQARESANARLTDMRHAQPAIAAVALSQLALIRELGIKADRQAGHSFGEVMALHSAGVFDAPTALCIACDRADAMSHAAASSRGGMLAVQAAMDVVIEALAGQMNDITLANDNSPMQVVLSGTPERLSEAACVLEAKGISSQSLPVAAAFHSPQVQAAVQPFAQSLSAYELQGPDTPVYANSTATVYGQDKRNVINTLSEQIGKPVLFRQTLESMYAEGVTTFIEVGPGSVLTNLARKTLLADDVLAVALDSKHSNGATSFLAAVGQLAIAGIPVDMARLFNQLPAAAPRPERGKHAVDILGSNYQKPYPPQHPAQQNDGVQADDSVARVSASIVKPANDHVTEQNGAALSAACNSHSPKTIDTRQCANVSHPQSTASANTPMAMQHTTTDHAETNAHHVSPSSTQSAIDVSATAPPVAAPARIQQSVFNEISARHADYVAAITAAHQSYLALAASVAGVADESVVGIQTDAKAPTVTNGTGAIATTSPPVSRVAESSTPNGRNGHGNHSNGANHVNGAGHAVHGVNGQNGMNGSSVLPTLATSTAPMHTPPAAPVRTTAQSIMAEPVSTAPVTAAPMNGTASSASQTRISTDLVRTLIAEKTGYPAEMIEDDMDLSGELGIDSIKQVEVLSALRTQVPETKDVGSADIGQLRTIRQIADFFG